MRSVVTFTAIAVFISFAQGKVSAQNPCSINTRIGMDGSLYYYIEPVTFYFTSQKKLDGGIITDKENYFIALEPYPFIAKKSSEKLTDPLRITLSNNVEYSLENFYVHYRGEDSLLRMVYLIPKKVLNDFRTLEVLSVSINMNDPGGPRTYVFRLHKTALREHLACFNKNPRQP